MNKAKIFSKKNYLIENVAHCSTSVIIRHVTFLGVIPQRSQTF